MSRQPEEQNQLVTFDETPMTPERPDVGINVRIAPRQARRAEKIMLSAAYNADAGVLEQCPGDLATCITLHVVEISARRDRFDQERPLQIPLDDLEAPAAGDFGPYYREGGQFQLDLRAFFELTGQPAHYSVMVCMDPYRTAPEPFEILAEGAHQ